MADRVFQLIQEEGLLNEQALRIVAERMIVTGEDAASAALFLKLAKEADLVRLLSRLHGFPGVDLSNSVVRLENLTLVPADVMRDRLVFPVLDVHGDLVLAMAEPEDDKVYDQLRFLTGRRVLRHVAIPGALRAAIDAATYMKQNGETEWRGKGAWKADPPPEGKVAVVRAEAVAKKPKAPVAAAGTEAPAHWLASMFEPPQPVAVPQRPAEPAVRTALVVDDDVEMRALEVRLLKPFSLRILESGDGKEALQLARLSKPDLLILDAMLPGMHGFEVCRAIKGDPDLRRARVVMVSGIYTGWKVGADLKEVYGADCFFEKPFHIDEVSRAVRTLLAGGAEDPAAEKSRREAALAACREGIDLARLGRVEEAVAILRSAAEKDPFSAEPHFCLGQALHKAGELHQALAEYSRAAELRPDLDQPLYQAGELYLALGFRKTAREVLARALEVSREPARRAAIEARLKELGPG